MKRTLYAPALAQLAQDEVLQLGGPQAEGKKRFQELEELFKAEGMAKL
jgi:hypothetical protein